MSLHSGPSARAVSRRTLGWLSALLVAIPAIGAAQNPRPMVIIGQDYAFRAPDTVEAGATVVSLQNRGTVRHEVVLFRLKQGRTLAEFARATTLEERRAIGDGLIGLIAAEAGQTALGSLLAELEKGRTYVLICNLRDMPDKPPHVALGMFASVYVK